MKKARILIVEDDPLLADDIENTVTDLGYEVVGSAASAKDALEKAELLRPDCVLLDISLKGKVDGITAGAEMRSRWNTPIVYLTAFSDPATVERAMITEPYGYIVKPFTSTDIRIAISLALYKQGKQKHPESASQNEELAKETTSEAKRILREFSQIELFRLLDTNEQAVLAKSSRIRNFSTGDQILSEGVTHPQCIILLSGRVSMVKTSANGRELLVEILTPQDLFHVITAFDEDAAPMTARTQGAAEVLCIPKAPLFQLLSKHPEFYKVFVREATRRLRAAFNVMRAIAHDKVETRIAATLSELSKRSGLCPSPTEGLRLTRQEIADMTGTTVETAIRVTRALEERGILDLSKRGLIIIQSPAELKELALLG